MAFGSWFKKLVNGAREFAKNKLLPTIKKVSKTVHDNIVPVARAVGDAIGGKAGETIQKISNVAERVSDFGADPEKNVKVWSDSVIKELQTPARRRDRNAYDDE